MNANSKFLFQLFILLTVPFNTVRAIQVVQAKLDTQPQNSTTPTMNQLESSIILYNANNIEVAQVVRILRSGHPSEFYSNPSQQFDSRKVVFQGPGTMLVPILLYHRIDASSTDSQYYVSPDKFEAQMKLLHDWGYTTITPELLVKAITEGADLPLHPIILTFDDGHLNNYMTAYPIMKKYGFTGTLYVVGEYMGTPEYMNVDQIREMANDGWEIGSHSMNHLDLTSLDRQQQQYEIIESRKFLEAELGIPIQTFAYPFGINDTTIINLTYSAGYIAAMGTGYTYDQGTLNLFALQRRGVNGTRDLNDFASVLPWQGDSAYLDAAVSLQGSDQ
jgi:peptidoglycan/xylan/chitin deacetylase (PgdA/CDA1 family)